MLEQLTNDPEGYVGVFMWNAPEYDNELVLMTTPNGRESVKVFRNVPSSGGGMRWKVVKTVAAPAGSGLPYFWSPEPFVHNGRSYLVFQLSPTVSFFDKSAPSHIGISGIGRRDEVQVLTAGGPPRLRLDPEYFITAKGPLIYYKRSLPETPTSPAINDGVWYIDTKLGRPDARQSVAVRCGAGGERLSGRAPPRRAARPNPSGPGRRTTRRASTRHPGTTSGWCSKNSGVNLLK